MRIARVVGDDFLDVETLSGVAGSLPFTFDQLDANGAVIGPLDISAITPVLEVTEGDPKNPGPAVYLTLTIGSGITRNNATGTFTVAVTMAQMTALALGQYAFRFLFFVGAECTERPFYGRWSHLKAR